MPRFLRIQNSEGKCEMSRPRGEVALSAPREAGASSGTSLAQPSAPKTGDSAFKPTEGKSTSAEENGTHVA